jgi:hypothetical protein
MVVVAVRDAETGGRAARLGLRMLFAAGVAIIAWFFGALLGSFTASANEAVPHPDPNAAKGAGSEPVLLARVTGTLTGLVSEVDQAATHVTTAAVEPVRVTIDRAVAAPVPLIQLLPAPQLTSAPALPRFDAPEPRAATPMASAIVSAPSLSAGYARPEGKAHQPIEHRRTFLSPSVQPPEKSAEGTDGLDTTPAPPPVKPGDQTVAVAVAHDAGGTGKHPFAVLGSRPAPADLRPGGVAASHGVVPGSRDAALPTTSPD